MGIRYKSNGKITTVYISKDVSPTEVKSARLELQRAGKKFKIVRVRTRREKGISIKDVDAVFSYYIRLRDSDKYGLCRCITCNRIKYFLDLDNGHHIKRQWMSHRFNEINCNAQCKACNNWGGGEDVKYKAGIIRKYGEREYHLLDAKPKHKKKFKEYELKEMYRIYAGKFLELLSTKELDDERVEKIKTKVINKLSTI